MGKKLENNGLWESSRMMLPQHKESLLKQETGWDKRLRPNLDEQEQELLHKGIGSALLSKAIVTLTVFGDHEDQELTGLLIKVDPFEQTLRMRCSSGYVTIPLIDVMKVS